MKITFVIFLILCLSNIATAQDYTFTNMPDIFPGTKKLTWEGDLSVRMLDGAHQFIEKKIDNSISQRSKFWKRDFSSKEAYERSVEANRKRFMKYIGVVDKNRPLVSYNVGFPEK
jgi:hypothetical protein